ncbi:Na-K-Cl cotransporter [Salinimicrobium gaetbulicola]|uniref:Na-K-Cl cotransporter n=1 Tax=Salinimicrobium gaetbulicola TaxID=999702 RepID=A0ABW3IJW9_9FLAO
MNNPFKKLLPAQSSVIEKNVTGLGTFGGVFTPSILTILGVIMYLRFGWVVGNVGLLGTFLIVTLSVSITFLTALSISSIATDKRVRTGGAYYMISRSLGIEAGGAIGIPLYLAQALSIALYTVGFAESVVNVFPNLNFKLVGLLTTLGITILALISAKTAIRAQYFIMVGIGLSLLSLLFGRPLEETDIEMWGTVDSNSEGFWVVFAVFFPAVTGIMAGVNMSGDLKDPAKSIPKGTLAAVGVGYLIYMTLPVILATRADASTLIEDPMIMRKIAYWGDAIIIGVWGATLSSALGSILGAPRVLQALARDRVLPQKLDWLGRGSGQEDAPRNGTIFTLGLALVAVYFGNLNIIAPILTMFFLTTYGVLNASAGIESLLKSPSFRPEFKVHWIFSILGTLGCMAVMFLINATATAVAFVFVGVIFFWLQNRELKTTWGGVRRGLWLAVIRKGLLNLGQEKEIKNWRPNPIVLSGAPTRRWHLIDLASAITHNRGILTVATVLQGKDVTGTQRKRMEYNIHEFLLKRGMQGLVRVISSKDPFSGSEELVKSYGLGPLVPNTVILGDSEEDSVREKYCGMITKFHSMERNVIIVRANNNPVFGNRKKIDVWWGGLKGNGGLMMIISYLLKNSRTWHDTEITIKMVVGNEKAAGETRKNMEGILKNLRTGAELEVIVSNGRSFDEILHRSSQKADLILLGMAMPNDNFRTYYENLQQRIHNLPTTLLVLAAEEISFSEVLMQQETFMSD